MSDTAMELGALGNKTQLGMLWDGHNYCTLGGLSLWDSTAITKQQQIEIDTHTDYEMQVICLLLAFLNLLLSSM